MRKFAIYLLAAINTALVAGFVTLMFVTGGYLEAHGGRAAGGSLMMLILWALANAVAAWRLFVLEPRP